MSRPMGEWIKTKRDEARALLLANGWSDTDAGRVLGPLSYRNGRSARMAEMYHEGKTLAEIGVEFNVTRERVRQILKKLNVSSSHGGAALQKRSKDIRRNEQRILTRNARALATYGCDHDTAIALNFGQPFSHPSSRTHKWRRQRLNAGIRGIEWKLSFVEWCRIWDESGNWPRAGRGKGRYCMARFRDAGAYEVGNVKICTNEENASESYDVVSGESRQLLNVRNRVLKERRARMLELHLSGKTNGEIAREFGVKPSYVSSSLCYERRKVRQEGSHESAPVAVAA